MGHFAEGERKVKGGGRKGREKNTPSRNKFVVPALTTLVVRIIAAAAECTDDVLIAEGSLELTEVFAELSYLFLNRFVIFYLSFIVALLLILKVHCPTGQYRPNAKTPQNLFRISPSTCTNVTSELRRFVFHIVG